MNTSAPKPVDLREFAETLRQNHRLWAIPTLGVMLLAIAYCYFRTPVYTASQAILVRDEAGGALNRQGRFDNIDAMKTAQETIVEISKNQALVAAALAALGPPAGRTADNWPSRLEIEEMQAAITVAAPKGAEFGRTEVIYLTVAAASRDEALARTASVCEQLESRLQELRDRKAQSVIAELVKGVALAQNDLNSATSRLEAIETEVGSDLGELRILSDSGAGDSNLRAALTQIKNELRQVQTRHDSNVQQKSLLEAAQEDPNRLVATSNQLLQTQPSLRRLKDGLVDAQLRTAQLLGKMSAEHPEVQAAQNSERAVRQHLFAELEVALRGLDAELQVTGALSKLLLRQQAEIDERLNRLASLRARYSNLLGDVRNCNETLQKTQKELSDARASQAAATSASLITLLDGIVAGDRPVGPHTAQIIMAGALAGFIVGLGLVFLRAPFESLRLRRFTDFVQFRRRATDLVRGRRTTDSSLPNASAARSGERRAS